MNAKLTASQGALPGALTRAERRRRLITLLESHNWNVTHAAKSMPCSPVTLYARMKELAVERPQPKPEERVRKIVDALRLACGVLCRAADALGVNERTLRGWCRELDVEPRDYRPR